MHKVGKCPLLGRMCARNPIIGHSDTLESALTRVSSTRFVTTRVTSTRLTPREQPKVELNVLHNTRHIFADAEVASHKHVCFAQNGAEVRGFRRFARFRRKDSNLHFRVQSAMSCRLDDFGGVTAGVRVRHDVRATSPTPLPPGAQRGFGAGTASTARRGQTLLCQRRLGRTLGNRFRDRCACQHTSTSL